MPTANHGTFEPSGHQQCIPTHYTQTHTCHDVNVMTLYHSLHSIVDDTTTPMGTQTLQIR